MPVHSWPVRAWRRFYFKIAPRPLRVLLCFGLMAFTTLLWAAVAAFSVAYEGALAAWDEVVDQASKWANAMAGALEDAIAK